MPQDVSDREREARGELLEHLSEFDDWLLEELIEDRTPPNDAVYKLCARVLGENRVLPCLIGSAAHGNGIVRVMKALRHEAPGPEALRARLQQQAGLGEPPAAVIFGSAYRKHVGKTLLLRALEPLAAGKPLGGRAPGQFTPADPRDGHHLDEVTAGTIVNAVKSDHLVAGRLATAEGALSESPPGTGRSRRPCSGCSPRPASATTSSYRACSDRSPRATPGSPSARTRRRAARLSAPRGRCTCGCCASG